MARKRKQQNDQDAASKVNRLAAEAERQATARAERDKIVAELEADHKATAKRLAAKPTDTRTLA